MARPTRPGLLYTQIVGRGSGLPPASGTAWSSTCLDASRSHASSLVTLPTLFGLPPGFDLRGRAATEAVREYHAAARILGDSGIPEELARQVLTPEDIRAMMVEVDLLRYAMVPPAVAAASDLVWQGMPDDTYVTPVGNSTEVVARQNVLGRWEVVSSGPGMQIVKHGECLSVTDAIRLGTRVVKDLYPDSLPLLHKAARWRQEPATEKQLALLRRLGIDPPRGADQGTGVPADHQARQEVAGLAHWRVIDRLTAMLREDLRVDVVMTVGQVVRRYRHLNVNRSDVRRAILFAGARRFYPRLKPVAWAKTSNRYEVCYLSQPPPDRSVVPHLLGLAEMRTILGARVLHWSHASVSRSWKRVSHRTPDVICELSDLGVVTLEYDYGKYTKETILRKAETARRMTRYQVGGDHIHAAGGVHRLRTPRCRGLGRVLGDRGVHACLQPARGDGGASPTGSRTGGEPMTCPPMSGADEGSGSHATTCRSFTLPGTHPGTQVYPRLPSFLPTLLTSGSNG